MFGTALHRVDAEAHPLGAILVERLYLEGMDTGGASPGVHFGFDTGDAQAWKGNPFSPSGDMQFLLYSLSW
ncbi:hypothetical protein GCM10009104_23890 [Marinobacterium maritimum]|uniref:Uncharacterized protein n=1 Tax=Marinobacterium maritimum TaxID=500162 RepID=A0ABP3TCX2_9GAMM